MSRFNVPFVRRLYVLFRKRCGAFLLNDLKFFDWFDFTPAQFLVR